MSYAAEVINNFTLRDAFDVLILSVFFGVVWWVTVRGK